MRRADRLADRDLVIVAARRSGVPVRTIANVFGLSRQRVYQILQGA